MAQLPGPFGSMFELFGGVAGSFGGVFVVWALWRRDGSTGFMHGVHIIHVTSFMITSVPKPHIDRS